MTGAPGLAPRGVLTPDKRRAPVLRELFTLLMGGSAASDDMLYRDNWKSSIWRKVDYLHSSRYVQYIYIRFFSLSSKNRSAKRETVTAGGDMPLFSAATCGVELVSP